VAGTLTTTYSETRKIKKVVTNWTSDASGDATTNYLRMSGEILRVGFAPSTDSAPSSNYDVVINDVEGFDVLNGCGANLSASVKAQYFPAMVDHLVGYSIPVAFDGILSVAVSNAGNATKGKIILHIKE